jgi:hypothetical protein
LDRRNQDSSKRSLLECCGHRTVATDIAELGRSEQKARNAGPMHEKRREAKKRKRGGAGCGVGCFVLRTTSGPQLEAARGKAVGVEAAKSQTQVSPWGSNTTQEGPGLFVRLTWAKNSPAFRPAHRLHMSCVLGPVPGVRGLALLPREEV